MNAQAEITLPSEIPLEEIVNHDLSVYVLCAMDVLHNQRRGMCYMYGDIELHVRQALANMDQEAHADLRALMLDIQMWNASVDIYDLQRINLQIAARPLHEQRDALLREAQEWETRILQALS